MKAIFVGAGSIGRRHIRDFYVECESQGIIPEIHVLRRKVDDLEEDKYIRKQITDVSDSDYDVAFITNPTNLHYDALVRLRGRAKYYFVEKPIFETTKYDVSVLGIDDSNTYVAAPMRHTLVFRKLKEIVESHRVFSARVICSSYLPEWRQGIDYRNNYSARREMGGGVCLDLIHEIDYVYDLFGMPESVLALSGKYSELEITSDDLAAYILKYQDKLCEIHLDYFGRKSVRTCEVYTREGSYIADFYNEVIILPNGNEINCHIKPNEEFINEMNYFYQFITGEVGSINPPSLALKTLEIALKGGTK